MCPIAVAKEVAPEKLYPDDASIKASIDKWLDTAMVIERNSIYWLAPKHNEAIIDEEQKNAKTAIEDALQALNAHISSPSNGLVLEQITLADIAIACALVGIYQNVLGEDVQSKYGTLTKWLSFIYSSHHFAPVLGMLTNSQAKQRLFPLHGSCVLLVDVTRCNSIDRL